MIKAYTDVEKNSPKNGLEMEDERTHLEKFTDRKTSTIRGMEPLGTGTKIPEVGKKKKSPEGEFPPTWKAQVRTHRGSTLENIQAAPKGVKIRGDRHWNEKSFGGKKAFTIEKKKEQAGALL